MNKLLILFATIVLTSCGSYGTQVSQQAVSVLVDDEEIQLICRVVTKVATEVLTVTVTPTVEWTNTLIPKPTATFTPKPSSTVTFTAIPTVTRTPTLTPLPSATRTSTPIPTVTSTVMPIVATYYVDAVGGSDSNTGTTRSNAWKTIQKAANTMVAGNSVVVLPGTYYNNLVSDTQVQITRSGVSNAPITYQAEGLVKTTGFFVSADYITIKGFDIATLADRKVGIKVDKGGYCVIENNYIHFSTMGGIALNGTPTEPARTHDCVIRNNRLFRNGQYGMEVKGQNHLIENNEVWGTIQHHPCDVTYANAGWLEADFLRFHGSGHVFRGNNLHDIDYGASGWTQGTSCSLASLENLSNDYNNDPHIDCFQTFKDSSDKEPGKNILFEQNYCKNLGTNSAAGLAGKAFQVEGGTDNLIFRNNLMVSFGIGLFVDAPNNTIVNNTFIGTSANNGAVGIYLTRSNNAVVQNNIFAYQENGIGSIWPDSTSKVTLTAGYNCVWRFNGAKPWRTADPHDVWGIDPKFINPTAGDYKLLATSPCIDAGITIPTVKNDFVGTIRPQGAAYDIGAYEIK